MDKKPGGPRPERGLETSRRIKPTEFARDTRLVKPILGEEYALTPYPDTALTQTEYHKLQRKIPSVEAMVDDSEERVTHDHNITSPRPQATEWMGQAVCRGLDTNLFYLVDQKARETAIGICSQCPVQGQCLGHAMGAGEQYGVWGGKGPSDRIKRRKKDS